MNQLSKNRLVGGGVLLFAGLLFAPAILTPESLPLNNPTLSVRIDSTNSNATISQNTNVQSSLPTGESNLQLESVDANVSTTEVIETTDSTLIPIVLESASSSTTTNSSPSQALTESISKNWLRVASFKSKENADKLANKLKADNYSVKVELIKIDGVNYRRVLVGPFTKNDELQSALKKISADGFNPSIQQ